MLPSPVSDMFILSTYLYYVGYPKKLKGTAHNALCLRYEHAFAIAYIGGIPGVPVITDWHISWHSRRRQAA